MGSKIILLDVHKFSIDKLYKKITFFDHLATFQQWLHIHSLACSLARLENFTQGHHISTCAKATCS